MNNAGDVFTATMLLMMALVVFIILLLLAQAFLGICVYNRAKSKAMANALAWAFAVAGTGLIGLVAFYIASGKTVASQVCAACKLDVPLEWAACPRCNQPMPDYRALPSTGAYAKRSTKFLIGFIASMATGILVFLVGYIGYIIIMMNQMYH